MEKISSSIATLGKVGYLPAPGTMGTIVTLPAAYCLTLLAMSWQGITILVAGCMSYWIIAQALPQFKQSDPSQIILDEVMGCLVTFFAIPFSWSTGIAGFVLFRLFDIFKPLGIKRVEKLPGAWGVLLDDVVAGLFANIILRLFFL
jgi:phosphatidylglycerophosphatase A